MFTNAEIKMIKNGYFELIRETDDFIEFKSKNTKHCWIIQKHRFDDNRKIYIYHKNSFRKPYYHQHYKTYTVKLAVRSVMRNSQDVVEVSVEGKGGRMNIQTFYLPEEKEFVLSLKEDNDRVFSTEEIRGHDADYHSARAFRARTVYERAVADMENNPDMREWYQQEIKRIFERDGKKLRENLDTPIFARGSHRKWLEEQE